MATMRLPSGDLLRGFDFDLSAAIINRQNIRRQRREPENCGVRHKTDHRGVQSLPDPFIRYQAVARNFGPQTIVRLFTGPGMMALTRRRFVSVSLWIDDWMVSR